MQRRESEIHFSRWLYEQREKNWLNIVILSLAIHALIFCLLYYIKPTKEIAADQNSSSIKINFSQKPTQTEKKLTLSQKLKSKFFKKKSSILTDTKKNSQNKFFAPSQPNIHETTKDKNIVSIPQHQNHEKNLNSFLPNSNSNYLNNLRQKAQIPQTQIQGDDGDIPVEGPSLAPTNQPKVLSRYAEKDMTMFQFTQEFRERFGAVWNSEERIVPPTSPLHPGDIVYYKVYIRSNGKLEKYENLSRASHPQKDYSDIDKLFSSVIGQVFPMSVPPKFANKNIILTEVIAIQVVDRNMPVRFSF